MVSRLGAADIDKYWHLLKPFFEDFAQSTRGEASAERLRELVRDEHRQCWIALDGEIYAVGLTESTKASVWFDFCTGKERELWQDAMVDAVEKHAGKRIVKTFSRPGWTPFLKSRGYRETHRVMEHG